MARTPQRPEPHQLETASRVAFESALPKGWAYRQITPDYGIDGEVEIFVEGAASGLTFKVQLKATRTDDRTVRLDETKDNYYAALRLPVLLVLFHEPTESIFVRWFHSFDPYSELSTHSSVVFRFTDEHRWRDETPERLRRETEMFYRIRDPRRVLPLQISITSSSAVVASVPSAAIEARLRSFLAPYQEILTISPSGNAGEHGSIALSREAITVDLQGAASFTIHYREGDADLDAYGLAHDAATALALLLDHIGQLVPAARILADSAEHSAAIRSPDMAQRVGSILIRSGRSEAAIELSTLLSEDEDSFLSAAVLHLPLLVSRSSLSEDEKTKIASRLLEQADVLASSGPRQSAAAAYRNAGSWFDASSCHSEALAALDRAAELDPGYSERAYFHRERGGSLFLLGEYGQASEAYARALEIGEDQRVLPLYADALLHAGRFEDSREAFAKFNRESSERNSEWQLKEWILDMIIDIAGDSQEIDLDEGCRIAAESDAETSPASRESKLLEALAEDGLCGQAWGKLGTLLAEQERFDEALPCFVAAALVTREVGPWILSIAMSLYRVEEPIFRDILKTGYFVCRDDFAEAVGGLEEVLDPTDWGKLNELLQDVVSEVQRRTGTIEFRILQESGYESLSLDVGPP